MTPEDIGRIILSISAFSVIKLFILLALFVYFIFSLVVLRQVQIMTTTFKTGLENILKIIAWVHLSLIIIIFIIALVFL